MKQRSTCCVVVLCVVACATVAAVDVWPTTRHVRTEDQNGDGRPDIWRTYDSRWRLTEVKVDSNFDGSPDIEEYYERGVLVRRESDRNFNGQADLIEEFDATTRDRIRSLVDVDYDGTADLLVLFQDGQPIYLKRTSASNHSAVTAPAPEADRRGQRHLVRLTNPFDSDTVVLADHTLPTIEASAGLSTSGGLPSPGVAGVGRPLKAARLVASDSRPAALMLLSGCSSRAPPLLPPHSL